MSTSFGTYNSGDNALYCTVRSVNMSNNVSFCSFTERVKEIIDVLKDLNRGVYKRTMVSSRKEGDEAEVGKLVTSYVLLLFPQIIKTKCKLGQ